MSEETTIHRVFRLANLAVQCLFIGSVAYSVYDHFYGSSVRIFTSVDEHTALNHGQKSVSVKLPQSVQFTSFGSCSPQWHIISGNKPTWNEIDCEVEKWDSATHGYSPSSFPGGFLSLDNALARRNARSD